MRNLISEAFIFLALILVLALGALWARSSVKAEVERFKEVLAEKRFFKNLAAALQSKSQGELSTIVMDLLLWDTRSALDWFEHKSILGETEKQRAVLDLRNTMARKQEEVRHLVRSKTNQAMADLILDEVRKKPASWRYEFLTRLDTGGHHERA